MHVQWLRPIAVRLEHTEVCWVQRLHVVELGALLCQLSWVIRIHIYTLVLQIQLIFARLQQEILDALKCH